MIPLLLLLVMAAEPPPDTQLFDKARANMVQILARQPNYVCVQTIDRSERAKPKARFQTIDSLRLEVEFVDRHELYAWPGSKKFDETNILDLVPEGSAIGTGAFAGHAQVLFHSNAAIVNGGYWVTEDGKRMARFLFTVPVSRSRYLLMKSRKISDVVGYSGDIWIEGDTARVAKIALHAVDIPARLDIQSTHMVIEYGETKIGTGSFWLPAQSTEEVTTADGRTDRNVTTFSGCRLFSGESTLRFDDPAEATPPPATAEPAKVADLPVGATFQIEFGAEVDSRKIHVGDAVPAALATDIKHNGQVLFAKGSAVEMRIVRVQRLGNWIGMEFALGDVTGAGAVARLWALPIVMPETFVARNAPRIQRDDKRPGMGTLVVGGNHLVVKKGFEMPWTVVAPARKKAP